VTFVYVTFVCVTFVRVCVTFLRVCVTFVLPAAFFSCFPSPTNGGFQEFLRRSPEETVLVVVTIRSLF
jgi:hypothetical protein